MNGEVAHLDLEAKRNGVISAELNAAASGLLHGGDDPRAHVGLERLGGHVPGSASESEQAENEKDQEVFPQTARSGLRALLGQLPWPPVGAGGFEEGVEEGAAVLILLSERRLRSQEANSSLIFSSVRISRILPETWASGTTAAPAFFS